MTTQLTADQRETLRNALTTGEWEGVVETMLDEQRTADLARLRERAADPDVIEVVAREANISCICGCDSPEGTLRTRDALAAFLDIAAGEQS